MLFRSGTLIITCRPDYSDEVVKVLVNKGITASIVGELTPQEKGIVVIEGGKKRPFEHPRVDPFWDAFYKSLQ